MADNGSGGDPPRRGQTMRFFRSKWKSMEERHFNGDLKGTLKSGTSKTWQAMNDWGDEIEQRHFGGDFVGSLDRTIAGAMEPALASGDPWADPLFGAGWADPYGGSAMSSWASPPPGTDVGSLGRSFQSSASSGAPAPSPAVPVATAVAIPMTAGSCSAVPLTIVNTSANSLWEEHQALEAELAKQRQLRQERTDRRNSLDTDLPPLRERLLNERRAYVEAEAERAAAQARVEDAASALAKLQAEHHEFLSRKARQEAEAQEHVLRTARDEQAERDWVDNEGCGGDREWARDGPETSALRDAKLTLAEAMTMLDQVRLECRKDLQCLEAQVAAADAANQPLRGTHEKYVAPGNSFFKSVRYLLKVASGNEET